MITNFNGKHHFLSDTYSVDIVYEGIVYTCSRGAFEASKVSSIEEKKLFSTMSGTKAKIRGRYITVSREWSCQRETIMYNICRAKFTQHEDLRDKLLDTGEEYLEFRNDAGDRTWGTVDGFGDNKLGKILMRLRDELRDKLLEEGLKEGLKEEA